MVQDLREAVGMLVKGVAMDGCRLLGSEQAWRHQRAPNDFDLLIRCAYLLSLSHELLSSRIARESEAAHKFQGNGGALVRAHLLIEATGVGLVEWWLHVDAPSWF
jgi:hypothetical protein